MIHPTRAHRHRSRTRAWSRPSSRRTGLITGCCPATSPNLPIWPTAKTRTAPTTAKFSGLPTSPRQYRRHPRWASAFRPHRDDADRASRSPTKLVGAAIHPRLCLCRHREPESPAAVRSGPFRFSSRTPISSPATLCRSRVPSVHQWPTEKVVGHEELSRRQTRYLPAEHIAPPRKGPGNAAFSAARVRLGEITGNGEIDWLGD